MTNFDIQDCLNKGYDFSFKTVISQTFNTIQSYAFSFIGFAAILFITLFIGSLIPGVNIMVFIMQGALTIGFAVVAHDVSNNNQLTFGNFFMGMNKNLGRFMLVGFLLLLITLLIMAPFIKGLAELIFSDPELKSILEQASPEELNRYIIESFPASLWQTLIITTLILIPVSTLFIFAGHFIHFYNLPPIQAMGASARLVIKHFFPILGLVLLVIFLNMIASWLFILVFITLPITFIAFYHTFAALTGLNETPQKNDKNDSDNHLLLDHFR